MSLHVMNVLFEVSIITFLNTLIKQILTVIVSAILVGVAGVGLVRGFQSGFSIGPVLMAVVGGLLLIAIITNWESITGMVDTTVEENSGAPAVVVVEPAPTGILA